MLKKKLFCNYSLRFENKWLNGPKNNFKKIQKTKKN